MEGAAQGGLQTVMKWKTVVAIFVVVVVYLVTGGLVFRALEQPFESSQKNTIALEKAEFLRDHVCVSPRELETLIQVSREGVGHRLARGGRGRPGPLSLRLTEPCLRSVMVPLMVRGTLLGGDI